MLMGQTRWKLLLSKVQTAHYKSANPRKLLAAIDVYRGLVTVPDVRELVLKKLKSMLLHHYPTVRVAAAESMFLITENDKLKECDWTEPVARLKEVVV
jgi:tubulin-specific chaperone D